jgi:tetratricopeptide (TPR) repeat protein
MKRTSLLLLLFAAALCPTGSPAGAAEELDAKAYYNRGTAFYGEARYEAAIRDLSSAIGLEPKAPDAYFNRGLSYRRLHRNAEAIADFSKAISLYPASPAYYFERCNASIAVENFSGAVSDCSEAVRLSPNGTDGYFLRGLAYFLSGDSFQALADGIRTLHMDPGHPHARRLIFETLRQREAGLDARDASQKFPAVSDLENEIRVSRNAERSF